MFTPVAVAQGNLGMVEPEEQRKEWCALAHLIFENSSNDMTQLQRTSPDLLDTNASAGTEVHAGQNENNLNQANSETTARNVLDKWPKICSLLGTITIGMPQMCYGFLRALVRINTFIELFNRNMSWAFRD